MGTRLTTQPLPPATPAPSRAASAATGAMVMLGIGIALGVVAFIAGISNISETPDTGPWTVLDVLVVAFMALATAALLLGAGIATWVLVRHRRDPREPEAIARARTALMLNVGFLVMSPPGLFAIFSVASFLRG